MGGPHQFTCFCLHCTICHKTINIFGFNFFPFGLAWFVWYRSISLIIIAIKQDFSTTKIRPKKESMTFEFNHKTYLAFIKIDEDLWSNQRYPEVSSHYRKNIYKKRHTRHNKCIKYQRPENIHRHLLLVGHKFSNYKVAEKKWRMEWNGSTMVLIMIGVRSFECSFLHRSFWCSWLLFIHVIDLFLTTQHDDRIRRIGGA